MTNQLNDLSSVYVGRGAQLNPNLLFLHTESNRRAEQGKRWKFLVLQGGTRSGKTYAICQFVTWLIENYTGLTISFVRATLPSIKATVLRDFTEIMQEVELWNDRNFNKSSLEYHHKGNLVEFFSVDNEQKVRGRKRHILICNEANEIGQEKMMQLLFRTMGLTIMDFNPSMVASYIYDDILIRKDAALLITTYKDNPFLTPNIINEIERLQQTDPELWKIYGCGQRGSNRMGAIFDNWTKAPFQLDLPIWYGLDFGYTNDPTAIVRIAYDQHTNSIYTHEVCYLKSLQNSDIPRIIKQDFAGLGKGDRVERIPIYCDSAEPKSIAELRLYGLSAYPCVKGNGSITSQIQFLKNFAVHYSPSSRNMVRELENYKWLQRRDSDKEFTNIPMMGFDHCMDATRYGVYSHLSKIFSTFVSIDKIKNQPE